MCQAFSILFYLQKNKVTIDGKAPIYLSITVNEKRNQVSIKRKNEINRWNSKVGKVNDSTAKFIEMNRYMDTIKHEIQQRLQDEDRNITALIIKNIFLSKVEKHKMLLKVFEGRNCQVDKINW